MAGRTHHEAIYRGAEQLAKLGKARIVLCGAGALGSNLADNLVRQGVEKLAVIDRDRVEEHNAGTQLYGLSDVGTWKVECLKNRLFRATNVEIEAVRKDLTAQNAAMLFKRADLIVDTFDNSASRQIVQDAARAAGIQCLHVGLYADYAEALWDEAYRVPRDVAGDVCDYPLARNLVLFAVAIASEVLVTFVTEGAKKNVTITLKDFAVREIEPS
jgi:molybdopterin-synthase adenylyltransferase